jgi:hypothetical protein
MIVFALRQIPKPQIDELGKVFFQSYVSGHRNPIFRALTLRIAGEVLDRSARLASDTEPINLNATAATTEQLEQARRFFSYALDDPALAPARYRRSREFFTAVLMEVNGEITRREEGEVARVLNSRQSVKARNRTAVAVIAGGQD